MATARELSATGEGYHKVCYPNSTCALDHPNRPLIVCLNDSQSNRREADVWWGMKRRFEVSSGVLLLSIVTILIVALACSNSDQPNQPGDADAVRNSDEVEARQPNTAQAPSPTASAPRRPARIPLPEFGFPGTGALDPTFQSSGSVIKDLIAGAPSVTQVGEGNSTPPSASKSDSARFELVDVVGRNSIKAVFDPKFVSASTADVYMSDSELVLGVEIDGESHAYSIPYLSGREVVNDVFDGEPVAVTW